MSIHLSHLEEKFVNITDKLQALDYHIHGALNSVEYLKEVFYEQFSYFNCSLYRGITLKRKNISSPLKLKNQHCYSLDSLPAREFARELGKDTINFVFKIEEKVLGLDVLQTIINLQYELEDLLSKLKENNEDSSNLYEDIENELVGTIPMLLDLAKEEMEIVLYNGEVTVILDELSSFGVKTAYVKNIVNETLSVQDSLLHPTT